jgi:hypothetical protein
LAGSFRFRLETVRAREKEGNQVKTKRKNTIRSMAVRKGRKKDRNRERDHWMRGATMMKSTMTKK